MSADLERGFIDALELHLGRLFLGQVSGEHGLEVGADAGQHHFVRVDLGVSHPQHDVAELVILSQELQTLQELLGVRTRQARKHVRFGLLLHLTNTETTLTIHCHSTHSPSSDSQIQTNLSLNMFNEEDLPANAAFMVSEAHLEQSAKLTKFHS